MSIGIKTMLAAAALGGAVACGALAACSTQPTQAAEAAKPDPRQGKEVKQLCFNQQIDSWRENGRSSVIVRRGVKEEFKLDLSGLCDPDRAFVRVGLVTRGSPCLSGGDQLLTDSSFSGTCIINKIYEWDESKKPKQTTAAK